MPDSPQSSAGPAPRQAPGPLPLPRIGVGVDVHPFSDDERTLSLAGLTWPGERALVGHSDADVAAHAACDALLSAAGIGDLGTHFGTDRPELAGATGVTAMPPSLEEMFLSHYAHAPERALV